jgi:uncharacterized protein (TIGR02996 family)
LTAKEATVADALERAFLAALKENAKDVATRLAFADWLEENERPYEAMLQRVKAGVSEARFRIRRKSDGLFFDGRGWSEKGKDWKQLGHVRAHFTQDSLNRLYNGTEWDDLEVVVYEVRVQPIAVLAVTQEPKPKAGRVVTVHEPQVGSS